MYGATVPYRTRGASFAAKLGAEGFLLRSIAPFSLYTPHTGQLGYLNQTLDRAVADGLGFGAGMRP